MTSKLSNDDIINEMNKRFIVPYIYTNESFKNYYKNITGDQIINKEIIEEIKDILIPQQRHNIDENIIYITDNFIKNNSYICDSCENTVVKTYSIKKGYSINKCIFCKSICCIKCLETLIEGRCILCL